MSKGGSTSSSVEIPAWLENAAIENINRARDVQRIGYTPYYGPDVAAFSPMQTQAMQATGMGAEAFGLAPSGFDPMAGMPQAQEFAGGLMGYSSAPLYEQSVDMLRQQRPAQAAALEGLFIDPITGQYSAPSYAPTEEQIAQTAYTERSRNAALDAALRNAEINENAVASQPASSPSQYIDPVSGKMSDVRMMSPSTPYGTSVPSYYDFEEEMPFKYWPDVGAKMDANGQYELHKYAPDRDFTYRETPFSDIQFQEDAPPLFDLEGNPIESMIRQPTIPDLRFGSPSTPILDPITEAVTQPVADIASQPIVDLAPKPRERSFVDVMADQGPTGTYNQKYWAEKLRSGSTQAELKAEQDAIAAAGGKMYLGSTPTSPMAGGTPSQDSMLGDVVSNAAGLVLNTGLLGAAANKLTGSYPVQNTPEQAAAIPVVDISEVAYKAPTRKKKKKSTAASDSMKRAQAKASSMARARAAAKKKGVKLATKGK
jgi:hypothetical protein